MKKTISIILSCVMLGGINTSLADTEAIINNDFENSEVGFNVRGSVNVVISDVEAHSGEKSLLLSERGDQGWHGVAASVASSVKLDESYNARMYVKAVNPEDSFTVKFGMELTDSTGTQYPQLGSSTVNGNEWTLVEGNWTADYRGNLTALNLTIETEGDGVGKSFYVDDVFFADSSVEIPSELPTIINPNSENMISYSGITVPTDVKDTENEKDIIKLMSLGVVNGYPDGEYKPEKQVTRAEFVTMLLRMQCMELEGYGTQVFDDVSEEHFASAAVAYASGCGICSGYGNGLFGPEDNVTYAQAVKMLTAMMGYSYMAELGGGYTGGYMSQAMSEGIYIKGESDINKPLTRAMTAELFAKALDAPLYIVDADENYKRSEEDTLLTKYFKGELLKGYVRSSDTSAVWADASGYGTVNIDGEEFLFGTTRAAELAGYYVDFIYRKINDENTLVYVEPRDSRNDELIIKASDIESYDNYIYKYEVDGKVKTARLDKDFTLIYNGSAPDGGNISEMMIPELGEVKLVSDGGNSYHTVYVSSYETYVVSSVNSATEVVYDINNTKLDLSSDNAMEISYVNPDGTAGTIRSIKKNDVLEIISDKLSGGDKMTVRIIRASVSGRLESVSDEEIQLNNEIYKYSDYFINNGYEIYSAGSEAVIYLDMNGDIAYMDNKGNSTMDVGYLMNVYVDESGTGYFVKYLNAYGTIVTAELAEKVDVDSKTVKTAENIVNILKGGQNTQKRIFGYTTDSSGKIRKIDFARAQEKCITAEELSEGENSLHVLKGDGEVKYTYKSATRTFFSGNNGFFALSPDAVIFAVPQVGSGYENDTDEYEVKSANTMWNDTEYRIVGYKTDSDSIFAKYAVEYKSGPQTGSISAKEAYVITKVEYGINDDGDDVHIITVYNNGEHKYYLKNEEVWEKAMETNDGDELEKGDIVRFDTDGTRITNLSIASDENTYNHDFYAANGYLYMKEDGYAFFTTERPETLSGINDRMVLIPLDDFAITVYNRETGQAYNGVPDDIIDYTTDPEGYSKIYITMNYENARTLICIVDE